MSRRSSNASVPPSIANGGGSERASTSTREATTSTSPVGIFGLGDSRSTTSPSTSSTHSERTAASASTSSALSSGRTTT